jgi:hypothetical protein
MKKSTVAGGKDAPPAQSEIVEPEGPLIGHGHFEYKDGTTYIGSWKRINGQKLKHGHGKITFPGA